jgi:hypothetical protein
MIQDFEFSTLNAQASPIWWGGRRLLNERYSSEISLESTGLTVSK